MINGTLKNQSLLIVEYFVLYLVFVESGSCYVIQAGLQTLGLKGSSSLRLLSSWDYRHAPLCPQLLRFLSLA